MNKFFVGFVKITGLIPYAVGFRTKVYYQDKNIQNRKIKGKAILISNHTALMDFAAIMYTFPFRILRYQMAELLFKKNKFMTFTLKGLGGIFVNRDSKDFTFLQESISILDNDGVVGVFPEGRLPTAGETDLLPFKPSFVYLAMQTGAKIIPLYTNGSYFKKERARIIIGTPVYIEDYIDTTLNESENLVKITEILREKVLELKDELERQTKKE